MEMKTSLFMFAIACGLIVLAAGDDDGDQVVDDSGMTMNQIEEILYEHNRLRAAEGGANVELMTWNPDLGYLAKEWVKKCKWKHGQVDYDKKELGWGTLGQNLFYTPADNLNIRNAINAWFKEKYDYNYQTNTCDEGKMCGHYTQVVWSNTDEVGCGVELCEVMTTKGKDRKNVLLFGCNYGPPGNAKNMKPYKEGEPCTKCKSGYFWCNASVCVDKEVCDELSLDCECKADCQNGGTQNDDCSCTCPEGFMGVDCSQECKDKAKTCAKRPSWLCKKKGFQKFMEKKCPAKCGVC